MAPPKGSKKLKVIEEPGFMCLISNSFQYKHSFNGITLQHHLSQPLTLNVGDMCGRMHTHVHAVLKMMKLMHKVIQLWQSLLRHKEQINRS